MKANKTVKQSGPYVVASISQNGYGVRIIVYPAYPEYGDWAAGRMKGEGGGPGIFTAMALADEMEQFLNQLYEADAVKAWKATLDKALRLRQRLVRAQGQKGEK